SNNPIHNEPNIIVESQQQQQQSPLPLQHQMQQQSQYLSHSSPLEGLSNNRNQKSRQVHNNVLKPNNIGLGRDNFNYHSRSISIDNQFFSSASVSLNNTDSNNNHRNEPILSLSSTSSISTF